MRYRFNKWYFELQDAEGSLFFAIFSDLRFHIFRFLQLKGYHFFNHQQQLAFEINLPVSGLSEDSIGNYKGKWGELKAGADNINLDIQYKQFNLVYHAQPTQILTNADCSHIIKGKHAGNSIQWLPIALSGKGELSLRYGNRELKLKGMCYVDQVQSNIYPWQVPVQSLYWGHSFDKTDMMVYTITKLTGEATGILMMMNEGKGIQLFDSIQSISEGKGEEQPDGIPAVSAVLTGKSGAVSLVIEPEQMIHRSGYFEDEAGKWSPYRKFLHTISLKPTGVKYLSKIHLEHSGQHSGRIAFSHCFSEKVTFNKK